MADKLDKPISLVDAAGDFLSEMASPKAIYHPAVMLILSGDRIIGHLDKVISNHVGHHVHIGWQWHHWVETYLMAEKTYDGIRQHLVYAIHLAPGEEDAEIEFLRTHLGMKEGVPSWLEHTSRSTATEAHSETPDPVDTEQS